MNESHDLGRPGADEVPWRRTHPLSPLVRRAWVLGLLLVGTLASSLGERGTSRLYLAVVELVVVGGFLLVAYLRWFFVTWRIVDSRVELRSGVFGRLSTVVEFSRIQTIDVVRPVHARPWGLCEVRLRVLGVPRPLDLAYVKTSVAAHLHTSLADLQTPLNGGAGSTPPDSKGAIPHGVPTPSSLRIQVPMARFVSAAGLVALSQFSQLVLPAVFIVVATRWFDGRQGNVFVLVAPLAVQPIKWLNQRANLVVEREGSTWTTRGGWARSYHQSLPGEKIQSLILRQHVLWRPFGWWSLDVVVAGLEGGSTKGSARPILVAGSWDEAWAIAEVMIPGATLDYDAVPRRVVWKSPLRFVALRSGITPTCIVQRSGRVGRTVWVIPRSKVQSATLVRGPWQRRWSLGSVRIGVAGLSRGVLLRDRDIAEAQRWWELLARDVAHSSTPSPREPTPPEDPPADEG